MQEYLRNNEEGLLQHYFNVLVERGITDEAALEREKRRLFAEAAASAMGRSNEVQERAIHIATEQYKTVLRMADQYYSILQGHHKIQDIDSLEAAIGLIRQQQHGNPQETALGQALEIAADRMRKRYIERALNAEARGTFGVWPEYKKYRARRRRGLEANTPEEEQFLARIHGRFTRVRTGTDRRGRWRNPDVTALFQAAYEFEQALEEPVPDLSYLEDKLREVERLGDTDATSVSETKIIYERLKLALNAFRAELGSHISGELVTQIEQGLDKPYLEERKKRVPEVIDAIRTLRTHLDDLKEQGITSRSIDDVESDILADEYKKFVSVGRDIRFWMKRETLPEQSREYIKRLYIDSRREAEILLGTYTGDIISAYGEDMRLWVVHVSNSYQEIQEVEALWRQRRVRNRTREITQIDRPRLERLREFFLRRMDEQDQADPSDVAASRRYDVYDVMVNKIGILLGEEVVIEPLVPEPSFRARPATPEQVSGGVEGGTGAPTSPEAAYQLPWEVIEPPGEDNRLVWKRHLELLMQLLNQDNEKAYQQILRTIDEEFMTMVLEPEKDSMESGYYEAMKAHFEVLLHLDENDPNRSERANGWVKELKERVGVLDRIRRIADVAHLQGQSDSMCSNWEGFRDHESNRSLNVADYDFFFGYWLPEGQRYEHADVIYDLIVKYIDWLLVGEGAKWQDGKYFKRKLTFDLWNKAIREHGIDPESKEANEIREFTYAIVYGLGIRQHTFINQYAMGATPTQGMGDLFGQVAQIHFLADQRYKRYKDWGYLQAAEMFDVPEGWIDWMDKVDLFVLDDEGKRIQEGEDEHGVPIFKKRTVALRKDGRFSRINQSIHFTRSVIEAYAPLREQCILRRRYIDPETGRVSWDNASLSNPYHTLFEYVFLRARERYDDQQHDWTFRDYLNGHKSFADFSKDSFCVPGGTYDVEKMDPAELRLKMIGADEEKDIDSLHWLLNKHTSYLKKNMFSVNWEASAHLILGFIDRMFRLYALCDDSAEGKAKLLEAVRIKVKTGSENLMGVGSRDQYQQVMAQGGKESIAWRYDPSIGAKGRQPHHKRKQREYDIRDYILNRLSDVWKDRPVWPPFMPVYADPLKQPVAAIRETVMWPVLAGSSMYFRLIDHPGAIGPSKVENDVRAKKRVTPVSKGQMLMRPVERLERWMIQRRFPSAEKRYRNSVVFALGAPREAQEKGA